MNKSSMREFSFLYAFIIFNIIFLIPSNAYAEEINVKSIGLEETTIITV